MRPSSFTLIETLAATALAALLMVAVLGVTATLGATHRRLAAHEDRAGGRPAWQADLLDLLRRDLMGAEVIEAQDGRLAITGFAALDPLTLEPTHRPAQVVYALEPLRSGGGDDQPRRLIRTQTLLDTPLPEKPWTALVCEGVTALEVGGLDDGDDEEAEAAGESAQSPQPRRALVPQRLQITIRWSDLQRPALIETLLLR